MEISHESDLYRDPKTMAYLYRMAASIFAHYGIDFSTAKRAGGWTNATWLAGGLALRLAVNQGTDKIRKEAKLGSLFPQEVGYPRVVETGVIDGYDWCLSQAIPGKSLEEAWKELDWSERITALRQLWNKVQAVHAVDIEQASDLVRKKAWYNSTDPDMAHECLVKLTLEGFFTKEQSKTLNNALTLFWKVLPSSPIVVNHGDLTKDNIIWHEGQVIALLDFEYAVAAPVELDLNSFIKMTFSPGGIKGQSLAPDDVGWHNLRQVVYDLTRPILSRPKSSALLTGYAILLELWMFDSWLAHPEGEGPVEQWQPYRILQTLGNGRGGYLAPFLTA